MDLLHNLLFACPELEILEEAAFRYLLCTTLSFGLKIKQSVWPLHSKFFDISKYCCHFIILSPGDENESLLASALKIRTTIYMHILGTVSRKKVAVLLDFVQMREGEGPVQICCPLFTNFSQC